MTGARCAVGDGIRFRRICFGLSVGVGVVGGLGVVGVAVVRLLRRGVVGVFGWGVGWGVGARLLGVGVGVVVVEVGGGGGAKVGWGLSADNVGSNGGALAENLKGFEKCWSSSVVVVVNWGCASSKVLLAGVFLKNTAEFFGSSSVVIFEIGGCASSSVVLFKNWGCRSLGVVVVENWGCRSSRVWLAGAL